MKQEKFSKNAQLDGVKRSWDYLRGGNEKKAKEIQARAIIKNPDASAIYHLLGLLHVASNQQQKALNYFEKIVVLEPHNTDYWRLCLETIIVIRDTNAFNKYALESIKFGLTKSQLQAFGSYLSNTSKNQNAATKSDMRKYLRQFSQSYKSNDFVGADRIIKELCHNQPDNKEFWELRSLVNIRLNNFIDAVICAKVVAHISPIDPKSFFSLGITLWAGKRPFEAQIYFYKSIAIHPSFSEAFFELSRLFFDDRKTIEGLSFCMKSIVLKPASVDWYLHLMRLYYSNNNSLKINRYLFFIVGLTKDYYEGAFLSSQVYFQIGNFDAAIQKIKLAVIYSPEAAEALYFSGFIADFLDQTCVAHLAYRRATMLKSNYTDAHSKIAYLYESKGKYAEALAEYQIALSNTNCQPSLFCKIGSLILQFKNYKIADNYFRRAICHSPFQSDFYGNYACSKIPQLAQSRVQRLFEKSMFANPLSSVFYYNYGTHYAACNHRQSNGNFIASIVLDPGFKRPYYNMANSFKIRHHLIKAIALYKRALVIDPKYSEAAHNLGLSYLSDQQFKRGFHFLEHRWNLPERKQLGYSGKIPIWRGEKNSVVFVWKEQGIGDEILYSSLFVDAFQNSQSLIVECDTRLLALFRRSFPNEINFIDNRITVNWAEIDYQIPIASLPLLFRNDVESFHNKNYSWLAANGFKASEFRRQLVSKNCCKIVGLSWRTFSKLKGSQDRCINLQKIAQLLNGLNFKIVNLQYGDVEAEIDDLKRRAGIEVFQIEELDTFNDIDALAATILACDFVVTVDNSTAHLAGALGVDCRLLLPEICDDRWGNNGNSSYWYQSVQLYRQEKLGDWDIPLFELKQSIKTL